MAGNYYDVIVIGGGASGMMAAGTAAASGKSVLILEKNSELGKKLKITGGGRCNITNETFDHRQFLANYGPASKFLFSAFAQFDAQSTFEFFTSRGLPLVTQARNRCFPHTEKATDVCRVMQKYASGPNVTIKLSSPVTEITGDRASGKITAVSTKQGTYTADHYILAVGGSSHPETGSTGDGFDWLRNLGHTSVDPTPSIVPLAVHDQWVRNLPGVSLSFMKITFFVDEKKAFSKTGKILFTHFGISGPLILNSASQVSDLLHEGEVTATIDCYPDTDHGTLDRQIMAVLTKTKTKISKTLWLILFPRGWQTRS